MLNDRIEAIEGIKEMRLQEKVDKIKERASSRICEFVLRELENTAKNIGVDMNAIQFSCSFTVDRDNPDFYGIKNKINIKL